MKRSEGISDDTDRSIASAVLDAVNARHGTDYTVAGHLYGGRQGGAWRIVAATGVEAVLKWSGNPGFAARRHRQPAMIDRLRDRGYPTPGWKQSGVTDGGLSYLVTELADGTTASWPSLPLSEVLAAIELQGGLGDVAPVEQTWSTYVEWVLEGGGPVADLRRLGAPERDFVERVLEIVARHHVCRLPEDDLVHGDMNTGNLLINGGHLAAIVDIDAMGTGTRAVDYAWLLREAYTVQASAADLRTIRTAGRRVAGACAFTKCAAATALDIVAFQHRHGGIGADLLDRMTRFAGEVYRQD